jgi:hypothetical protein
MSVKQGVRFFLKPQSFVNQLQWSSHHSFILTAFCTTALIETQVGRNHALYTGLASLLASQYGLGMTLAIWLVTFLKLTVTLLGALAFVEMIGLLGGMFGRQTSRRVLSRRLAVVFSLILVANTLYQFAPVSPWAGIAAAVIFLWSVVLGYFSLRTHFGLTLGEAASVGVFSLFVMVCAWHLSLISLQRVARYHSAAPFAKRSAVTHSHIR